jgi:hypothetical protein
VRIRALVLYDGPDSGLDSWPDPLASTDLCLAALHLQGLPGATVQADRARRFCRERGEVIKDQCVAGTAKISIEGGLPFTREWSRLKWDHVDCYFVDWIERFYDIRLVWAFEIQADRNVEGDPSKLVDRVA